MTSDHAPTIPPEGLLARIGRSTLGIVSYLGGMGVLAASAARSLARPRGEAPPLGGAVVRQWVWLFGAGLPLVAMIHAALGAFLAMQAYYGATFAEAAGPVVGVGLYRNLAPLMVGFIMAGLMAARLTPELRRPSHLGLDDDPRWLPDREVRAGRRPDPRTPTEPARLVGVRLAAAALAGPILVVLGGTIGTLVGLLVARKMTALPPAIFLAKFFEMFWTRDVIGLVGKGAAFGLVSALFACHEGLRGTPADGPDAVPWAASRAACLATATILFINSAWFLLFYHAGPAFGPTVLTPP